MLLSSTALPALRRDAGGRRAPPGSSGEERPVSGSCDGVEPMVELAERQAASVGLGRGLRPQSCSWKRTHPAGHALMGSCSEECQAVKMIVTAGWERAAVPCVH